MEATSDRKVQKEIEERIGVLQTSLKKAEASVTKSEDCLEESQIQKEEARQEDQGQSDSSEGQDGDVMMEEPEESGQTGAESAGPLRSQEADVDDIPPLTSDDATAVTAEEEEVLMGGPTSVAGEMARLQVSSPDSHKPENGEIPQ